MHLGSETTVPKRSNHAVANVVGTAIALLTLALPLLVIAHYTPDSPAPAATTHIAN